MTKRFFSLLCALVLALTSLALAEEVEDVTLEDETESTVIFPLPIDFSAGHVAPEENYEGMVYDDASLTVRMEQITTETAIWNVAYVTIADPSQLRTSVTSKGRTNKISAMAKKVNAVVAIGGDYFGSDEGGYIVRQGEVIQKRKSPYETRDLLCVDENGDFHILLRKRDAKVNGKSKSINPDFAAQLKALVSEHTMINVFEWGPALVIDGVQQDIPASYSGNLDHREPRCAIGQTGRLQYVLVVADTVKHHDRSGKEGATGEELAQFMFELGCTQAYNLDGGNSALMVFHGENFSDKTVSEERSVSDIIYFATAIDAGLD